MVGTNPFAKRVPVEEESALVEEATAEAPASILQRLIANPPRINASQFVMGIVFADKVAQLPAPPPSYYRERLGKRAKRRLRGKAKAARRK